MIAALERPGVVCIVLVVHRSGFKAKTITYCHAEGDASHGTVQIPEAWFREGRKWTGVFDGVERKPCDECKRRAGL